jgi:hypothetical protein
VRGRDLVEAVQPSLSAVDASTSNMGVFASHVFVTGHGRPRADVQLELVSHTATACHFLQPDTGPRRMWNAGVVDIESTVGFQP